MVVPSANFEIAEICHLHKVKMGGVREHSPGGPCVVGYKVKQVGSQLYILLIICLEDGNPLTGAWGYSWLSQQWY